MDLGKDNIGKLLLKQSLPAVVGFMIMSLYNLADTIFIGWSVGPLGIGAVAIVFPLQMIVMGISQGVGIGSASIISRALGAKDQNKASKVLGNYMLVSTIISSLLVLLVFLFLEPLLVFFGATESILPLAKEYLSILLIGMFFIFFATSANSIIRAEGHAKYAMSVMIISAVVNTIGDAILIFGFDMGMAGAAWATTIAQIMAACAALYFIFVKSKLQFTGFSYDLSIIKEKFSIGISSFARMMASVFMVIIINNSLGSYGGDMAIASFGVIHRIMMFSLMPMFGIIQGMQPILGYNYGAKQYSRAKDVIMRAVKVTTIISSGIFLIVMISPKLLINLFTNDPSLIEIATPALRIINFALPLVGFQVVASGMYQAMGKAVEAFILSILRQVLFLIPFVLILPLFFGLNGIFISFPLADFLAAIIIFIMFRNMMRKL